MAKTIEQLKAQSAEVKNASVIGENTATRVGNLFNDIVEHVEAYEAGQAQKDTEQSTSINAETARATEAETMLSERINQETSDRKAMDETIGVQLSNEIERAKKMELGISTKLDDEIKRAQEAENDLQEKITSEAEARDLAINNEAQARTQNDQLLSQAIAAEQERAEAAEEATVTKNEEQDQKLSELEQEIVDIHGGEIHDITDLYLGESSEGYYIVDVTTGYIKPPFTTNGIKYEKIDLSQYGRGKVIIHLSSINKESSRQCIITNAIGKYKSFVQEKYISLIEGYDLEFDSEYCFLWVSHSEGVNITIRLEYSYDVEGEIPNIKRGIEDIKSDISVLNTDIESILGGSKPIDVPLGDKLDGYWRADVTNKVIFDDGATDGQKYAPIDMSNYIGKNVTIKISNAGNGSSRVCALANADKKYVSFIQEKDIYAKGGEHTFIISDNGYYLYISCKKEAIILSVTVDVGDEGELNKLNTRVENIEGKVEKELYVSPNGNDSNDGSKDNPLFTFDKALQNGATSIKAYGGIYKQTINLGLSKTKQIHISSCDRNSKSLIIANDAIIATSASLHSGRVYEASADVSFATDNKWLFVQGVQHLPISLADRHPLHRGRLCYNQDTRITKCKATALADAILEIENDTDVYRWYYDTDNKVMYFSTPSVISNDNPLCYSSGKALFSNCDGHTLVISGIEVKYLKFNLDYSINSVVTDCISSNVYGAGAFTYNRALNTKFVRCEASNCKYIGSTGDGFNGHAQDNPYIGSGDSKNVTTTVVDCWSHHNSDDGISDHGRCETTVIGGLFEWNGKAGLTPAYGAHWTAYNVLSRRNYCGFLVTQYEDGEGGEGTQMICYNCVADSNIYVFRKSGFDVQDGNNSMTLIDCKSINNEVGYRCKDSSNLMTLINCSSFGHNTLRTGSGVFDIQNAEIVKDAKIDNSIAYTDFSMFEKFAVIGDSFASGQIWNGSTNEGSFYNLSWGQVLARRHGNICVNMSKGGLTTRTWLTDDRGLSLLKSSEAQQLYICALGINDRYTSLDIGTVEDIDNGADTFYGNYGRIISEIQKKAPDAKIIISTMAVGKGDSYNNAIISLAEHFSLPLIKQYDDKFFTSDYYLNHMDGGHPIAPVYAGMATAIDRLICKCIIENFSYFRIIK